MLTFFSEQCICTLFTDPQISFFINFFIKNGSHGTIYTLKNYFATVISAISFQFQQNKSYPNRPSVSLEISKSLFFILKQTQPFTPLHQNHSSFFTPPACCCRRITHHLTPPPHFVSTFHQGSSHPLRLGFLVSDQVKFLPFSSPFFCILCL